MMENKKILKLKYLHDCIKGECTGTPCFLRTRMQISPRTFFYMINDLREMGAKIKYCRKRQTYYYENDFQLEVEYKVKATII